MAENLWITELGVEVEDTTMTHLYGAYIHRRGLILLNDRLAPIQRRSTLMHELGHAFYGHTESTARTERITSRIADKLDTIADNLEQVLPLIGEALTRNAWKALGYASPTAYVSERFAGALERLSPDVRRPVVAQLSAAGMSTRAIAPVIGATHTTVRRDLEAGGTYVPPAPKSDAELLAGAERSPEAVEEAPRFTDEPGHIQPVTGTITGMDGKEYSRPEPKPEPDKPRRNPLPDQARTAGWEVRKSVERIERIMNDDRLTRNKEEVAAHLRGHLQYAIETLQATLDQLN